MFVRVVKFNNISYLKIVKSFRENGKVKQKVIANLGRLDSLVKNGVDKVVKKIEGYLGEKNDSDNNKVDINTLTEIERVNYGFVAYKKIWNYFDLDNILEDISSNKKIKYDIVNSVFSMVINKLLNPSSKLFHFNHKDQYFSLNEDMKLQYFYRTLDILEENKEEIERLENLLKFYQDEISKLPKGYISIKNINGHKYCYQSYREGKKVKTVYIGDESSEQLNEIRLKIDERKKLDELYKQTKKNLKEAKGSVRGK